MCVLSSGFSMIHSRDGTRTCRTRQNFYQPRRGFLRRVVPERPPDLIALKDEELVFVTSSRECQFSFARKNTTSEPRICPRRGASAALPRDRSIAVADDSTRALVEWTPAGARVSRCRSTSSMLRSLKFVRKLGLAVGPQRLALHRLGSLNSSETRLRLDGYYCLEDASVAVACTSNHQQKRDYVTDAAVKEADSMVARGKLDVFTEADFQLKRYGKIYINHVNEMLQAAETTGILSSSQALLLIRSCGDFLFNESTNTRTALANKAWQTIKDLGVPIDVSHYNAYIQVNLDNEANFSPVDILLEMKGKNIEPNRVTFQRLVEHYCTQGDIAGATKILEHMNEKGLPLNENVFNSLIKGHSISGDLPSALRILDIMKETGIEPTSLTYTSVICAHARKGDLESMLKVVEEWKRQEISLSDTEILEVIYTLAVNNFPDLIDKVIALLPKGRFYKQAATSYINKLIHRNQVDVAYKIHLTTNETTDGRSTEFQFIRKLTSSVKDVAEVIKYCNLIAGEHPNEVFGSAVYFAYTSDQHFLALPLLKAWKKSGGQIREHYFRPLILSCVKKGDFKGVSKIIKTMVSDFNIVPYVDTLREFVVPRIAGDLKRKAETLKNVGVNVRSSNSAVLFYALWNGKLEESADFIASTRTLCLQEKLIHALRVGLKQNPDVKSFVEIVHHQYWIRVMSNTVTKEILKGGVEDELNTPAPYFAGRVLKSVMNELSLSQRETASDANGKETTCDVNGEDTVSAILNGFIEKGMSIDSKDAETIRYKLTNKGANQALTDLVFKLVSENLTLQAFPLQEETPDTLAQSQAPGVYSEKLQHIKDLANSNEMDTVEKELEELESSNIPYDRGFYFTLIKAYVMNNNLQKASEWFNRFDTSGLGSSIPKSLALRYSNLLVKNGHVDDALAVLERGEADSDRKSGRVLSSLLISNLANTCPERLEEFFELFERQKFFHTYDPVLLAQLIQNYLKLNNVDKALEKFFYACNNFKITPCVGLLMKKLIDTENAKSLQDVTKHYTKIHGELNALLHLAVAFAECNRPRQAKKILQVPGVRFPFERFMKFATHLKERNDLKALENLLQAGTGAFRDMTPLYSLLLNAYDEEGDWKKCLSLWIQMQENDVQPAPEFLVKLEKILIAANQEVPFARS